MKYRRTLSLEEIEAWVGWEITENSFLELKGKTIYGIIGKEWKNIKIKIKSSSICSKIEFQNCENISLSLKITPASEIFIENSKEIAIEIQDGRITFLEIKNSQAKIEIKNVRILGNVNIENSKVELKMDNFSIIGNFAIKISEIEGELKNGEILGNFLQDKRKKFHLEKENFFILGKIAEII